jgi:2-dehydro-3-deoxy-D-arabinonate dehydratase
MKLYRTINGIMLQEADAWYALASVEWDELVNREDLPALLRGQMKELPLQPAPAPEAFLPPIGWQEVWAAGVTYLRSRDARMDESNEAGGSNFYDRVYDAARPELFFKSMPERVVGTGDAVRLRKDSRWTVPEPELALLINKHGKIAGYTIGNDMSCRDIEGENPLYLPQAKVYDGACALGPCVLVAERELPRETSISMAVRRAGRIAFSGATALDRMKRTLAELADWLTREQSFPRGCYLFTGTGVVPQFDFTLKRGDEIFIKIEGIGELYNFVGD